MQEFFYEECSKCSRTGGKKVKYTIFFALSIILFVGAISWFLFVFFGMDITKSEDDLLTPFLVMVVPTISAIILGIVFIVVKNNVYIDYDYSVITDNIRISKVKRERKRVPVLNFNTYHIEIIGKAFSETYDKYCMKPNVRRRICTDNLYAEDGKDFYYMIINFDSEKQIVIIEATTELIKNILKTTRKTIIDKDMK